VVRIPAGVDAATVVQLHAVRIAPRSSFQPSRWV
jgi:hypothetical protein